MNNNTVLLSATLVACLATGSAIGFMAASGDDEPFSDPIFSDLTPDAERLYHWETSTRSCELADFNGDGFGDLAVFTPTNLPESRHSLNVWWGTADGEFTSGYTREFSESEFPNVWGQSWMTAGDVNGDGKPDIVIMSHDTTDPDEPDSQARVLLGNGDGSFTCAGDINDDGQTSVPDLLRLLEDWNCQESQGLPH